MSYLELVRLAAPETIVVLTALAVLAADLLALQGLEPKFRLAINAMISSLGCLVAIGWMLALPQHGNLADGVFVADPLTQLLKIALLALTIFSLLLAADISFTGHVGEYFALILLSVVGMMFLVSAEDLLMIFVSLEMTSLTLYLLTAFDQHRLESAEAGLKYFLFGAMSAAFALFGFSLLYGFSGSTNLGRIAAAIHGPQLDPLLILAMVMTVVGFAFKVAAAPFHLWAPDTYQGAPIPSAALIASGSKVAGFFIFAKVMLLGFPSVAGSGGGPGYLPGWIPLLAALAAASMVLGNLAAIVQTSVRRLLAYSAIAHAGYMLLGVMAHSSQGLAALLYYAITYGLTTVGAFGVVSVVQDRAGGDQLSDFSGLSRRAPVLSACMLVFMLSLAGIPPLAGFFGKFFVFASALREPAANLSLLWLVVLALGASAVSLYYYLQVLKRIYVSDPSATAPVQATATLREAAIVLLALAVVLLGCFPGWLIDRLAEAIRLAGL